MNFIDTRIFYWLNSFAGVNDWFDRLIIFRAEYLGYVMGLALFGFLFITIFQKYRHLRVRNMEMIAISFAAALISRFGVGESIRFFYNRPRPFEAIRFVHQLISHPGGHSFPSGHALFFFALAAGVSFYYPRAGFLFFAGAVWMGLARISVGIHWPSDILAGAVLGVLTAFIVRHAYNRYFQKK